MSSRFSEVNQTMRQTIAISPSVHFSSYAQQQNFMNIVERSQKAVCQIHTPDQHTRGTGFLIGGNLLITNNHVLKDKETARKSWACFFRVIRQDPLKEATTVEIIKIDLDPDSCFFSSSPNIEERGRTRKIKAADDTHLDFTVVALKLHPHLSAVQDCVLPLFDAADPILDSPICVLQYPDHIDSTIGLKGDLKLSYGSCTQRDLCVLHYDAPTDVRASGGAVINNEGKLVALHYQSIQEEVGDTIHVKSNCGVIAKKIASTLMAHKEKIDECLKISLPAAFASTKIINFPAPNDAFTGRIMEFEALHQLCSSERRVALTGLGGVGKTALVVHYANQRQADYSWICFIPSITTTQIETGLLNLANVLKVPEGSLEQRLLFLKTQLEAQDDKALLVFDGVDDEQTFATLETYLPERGCTTLLVSSRLQGMSETAGFSPLPLQGFTEEDAVAFLLKTVGEKDTDAEQAKILAAELCYLPLALKHAAAFIKWTRGSTFEKYREGLQRKGIRLLGKDYVPRLGTGEETILTTWKKSIDAILQNPQGVLAEDLLNLFSVFADAPVPVQILQQLKCFDEEDREMAIRLLLDYSLLEERGESYVMHSLLQKVVRHELEEASQGYFLQALKLLDDSSKDLDPNNFTGYLDFGLYIPHFEAVIEATKDIVLSDSSHTWSLLVVLFNYYVVWGQEKNIQRVGEIVLRLFQNEGSSRPWTGNAKWSREDSLRIAQGIGEIFGHLGRHDEALIQNLRALKIHEEILGDDNVQTADSYSRVGVSLDALGRYKEAFKCKSCALEIHIRILGNHPKTADSFQNVGRTLSALGKHRDALWHSQRALEIRKLKLGNDHPKTADSFENLGTILRTLGKYRESLKHSNCGLEIRKQKLGNDHPKTADSHFGIGVTLFELGEYKKALEHSQCALEIHKLKFGDNHLTTAASYFLVGATLYRLNSYKEAVEPSLRALAIRRQKLGQKHRETAISEDIVKQILLALKQNSSALVVR